MARFDRKPNATPKSILKPSNNHTSNQPKSASFPSHANPNRSYATTLNGKTPQNFKSDERSILKSVTLDATDLLDTSDMRNVIFVKVRDVHLILNINNVLKKRAFMTFNANTLEVCDCGLNSTLPSPAKSYNLTKRCHGLPLHAWTTKAYKKFAGSWGEPLFVDEDPHDNISMGRVCIKTKIQGQITETCKVVIHGKPHNLWVKKFAGWVPNIKTIESLSSENSKTDNSDNHDHDIDDNGFHDIEEGEIRNVNVNQEEEVVKDTQWSVGVEQIDKDQVDSPINNTESHKQPTKETPGIQKEDLESISKPPGFEGYKSNSPKFSAGRKHQNFKQPSTSSFAPAKISRVSKSHSKSSNNHGSMVEAFTSHIEMGNILGYDMEGISGGLVSIWDLNVFTMLNAFPSENILIVEGIWTSSHLNCFMINVYAHQEDKKNETLWHNILDFKDRNLGRYFIFGDFNVVRYTYERSGGHLFTRIKNHGNKLSKLDRFLITENSASLMHNYSAQALGCHILDHRPIILSHSSSDFGPIPFELYNSWPLDKHLYDIVAEFWEHHVSKNGSNLIMSFKNKMKALKPIIKEWSKNRSSSQPQDKEDLIREIKDFDDNITSGTGDVMVGSQRSIWLSNHRRIELEENLDFSQKAKIK
nr:RNA-directed DNA polymerase, eukaryota [Tanacetum cinerariifolium]